VLLDSCYEVKYTDKVREEDVSHLKDIAVDRKIIVTRDQTGKIGGIELVPLWRFLMEE
jgi:predicted AAA+ superfamily ATPase